MARECSVKAAGGKVSVQLRVDNGIISGGNFRLYTFATGQVVESIEIYTKTNGENTVELSADAASLSDKALSWEVMSCSPIVTDRCKMDIKILQDGRECAMTPVFHKDLTGIPQCKDNMALPVKGGLRFITN